MARCYQSDELIDNYYRVLDKGFIALKDYMGSDESIEAAARTSYQSGTRTVSDTRNLLRYLLRHRHTSPFEQVSFTFHMKMPLFVIQQLLRHRTAKLNQESHRYSEVSDDKYRPDVWRLQSTNNKQASDGVLPNHHSSDVFLNQSKLHEFSDEAYNKRLEAGVSRELARIDTPHSTYSQLYWTMDLHNLFHFMKLRLHPHAQKEIRDYAHAMACIVQDVVPISFEAWCDYSLNSMHLSHNEIIMLHSYMTGNAIQLENCSQREHREFEAKLEIIQNNPYDVEKFDIGDLQLIETENL